MWVQQCQKPFPVMGGKHGIVIPTLLMLWDTLSMISMYSECRSRNGRDRKDHLLLTNPITPWLVVWNIDYYFSIDWKFHHPNWRTLIFFRGVECQPPTSPISPAKIAMTWRFWCFLFNPTFTTTISCCLVKWIPASPHIPSHMPSGPSVLVLSVYPIMKYHHYMHLFGIPLKWWDIPLETIHIW